MNYIELINNFWKIRRIRAFSSHEADFYFALMQECNLRGWENPFECPNGLICAITGMSENTLMTVRQRLQDKGLIKFEKGRRRSCAPLYTIFNLNCCGKNNGKDGGKNEGKSGGKNGDLILHKHKHKPKPKHIPPLPPQGDVDVAKSWRDDIEIYKADLRKAYASAIADQKWIAQRQRYHPNLNIALTLERACVEYWATETGWLQKLEDKKTKTINWRATFSKTIDLNKVYKTKDEKTTDDNGITY